MFLAGMVLLPSRALGMGVPRIRDTCPQQAGNPVAANPLYKPCVMFIIIHPTFFHFYSQIFMHILCS